MKRQQGSRLPGILLVGATIMLATAAPASALSQITGENGDAPATREGIVNVPLPPVDGKGETATGEAPAQPGADAAPAPPQPSGSDAAPTGVPEKPAEIFYGEDDLPPPVRELRRKLIEASKTGDIEALRPYLRGRDGAATSTDEDTDDPITFLNSVSGDGNGVEILAILLETLEAGHVHLDQGSDTEVYVWPYFTQVDLGAISRKQLVELFELVTAGDYLRMVENGSYDFYRVGISPDGHFEFFVSGD